MNFETLIFFLLAILVISSAITKLSQQIGIRFDILDRPNERSSHTKATPRIGGIGIVLSCFLGGVILLLLPDIEADTKRSLTGLLLGGGSIAAVCFLDDVLSTKRSYSWHHSALLKFLAQLVGVLIVVSYASPQNSIAFFSFNLGWLSLPFTVLWILWMANLYNFMDGIDGICAGAALIHTAFFSILFYTLGNESLAFFCLIVAVSCLGFLHHNFPPAKVFMGDVGSIFLGFLLAGLAVLGSSSKGSENFLPWVMICGAFIFDATFTLLRRGWREKTILGPHRTHLYQRLIILGYSHGRITTVYYVISIALGMLAVLFAKQRYHLFPFASLLLLSAGTALVYWLEEKKIRMSESESGVVKIAHLSVLDSQVLLLLNQLRILKEKGYEVHVICHLTKLTTLFEKEGLHLHPIPLYRRNRPLADLRLFFQLYSILRREKFDIVHTHTPKMELIGQMAAKVSGVPVGVYTSHGFYFRKKMSAVTRRLVIFIAKIAGHFSDHTFIQSQSDLELALKERIYNRERVSFLGNGVNLQEFNRANFSLEDIANKKRSLGIPMEQLVVGMVGRYVNEKGYREFIEAASILSSRHSNLFFLTVGMKVPGERDPFDPTLFNQPSLKDQLLMLDWRMDMPELYSIMDIVALPSYREGFPRCLVEACSMSLPIVATNIPGCSETVMDGINGILIPVRQTAPLVDALETLIHDGNLRMEMGTAGRRLAEQHFDEQIVVTRITKKYQELLEDKYLVPKQTGKIQLFKFKEFKNGGKAVK
jgi:UDP-N-acetylmuramyl pentapeptide phosphotransferase/UDP-N-acetylglucosamine-1-phosphate transferase/glycosyltransferase involved in cell wall biosynthesis